MGTVVEIHAEGESKCSQIEDFTQKLSIELSFQNRKSLLNTLLNKPVSTVALNQDLEKMVDYGIKLFNLTDGYFDILFRSPEETRDKKISDLLTLNKNLLIKHRKNLIFDFSGMAKGYVIMKLFNKFFSHSSEGYINAGGDIIAWGKRITVSFRNFRGKMEKGCIKLKGKWSIFSSGTYLRKEIYNPFSGKRIDTRRVSVVVGTDPVISDGLATALIVKPELIEKLEKELPQWSFYVEGSKHKWSGGKWGEIYISPCKK